MPSRKDDSHITTLAQRLYSRFPIIGRWIRRRAARALAEDLTPAKVRALAEVTARGSDEEVRAIALEALAHLPDQACVDAFCAAWAATRQPGLAALMVERGWLANGPAAVRLLGALKLGRPEVAAALGAGALAPLLDALAGEDREIAGAARGALLRLDDAGAREKLCRQAMGGDRPAALEIALAAGYAPRDLAERALFYFLAEQWPAYEALDFDRQLLAAAYRAAGEDIRARLREKLRKAGRLDFLTVIAGSDYRSRAAGMTPDELEVLLQMLVEGREWGRLWGLAFEVSLPWSHRIVGALETSGWQPADEDGRAVLSELLALRGKGMMLSGAQASQVTPPAIRQARVQVKGRVNAIAFSPVRPLLAVGTGRRQLVLWDFVRGEREQTLDHFEHSLGRVAFMPDGALLAAERTNGDAPCAIYAWHDASGSDERCCLGGHAGSVTVLEPLGNGCVLAAGRDGMIRLHDVASCRPVKEETLGFWPRAAAVAPGEERVALLHDGLSLADLAELRPLATVWKGSVGHCAAFAPDGKTLVLGKGTGNFELWATGGDRLRQMRPHLAYRSRPARGVVALKARGMMATAGGQGEIEFVTWDNRVSAGTVHAASERLTFLRVSENGDFMAVGDTDSVFTLWDLRALDIPPLFERPFARMSPGHLAALRALAGQTGLDPRLAVALRFMQQILQYRLRFEVEIGDTPSIRTGEFEIEIE